MTPDTALPHAMHPTVPPLRLPVAFQAGWGLGSIGTQVVLFAPSSSPLYFFTAVLGIAPVLVGLLLTAMGFDPRAGRASGNLNIVDVAVGVLPPAACLLRLWPLLRIRLEPRPVRAPVPLAMEVCNGA